MFGRARLQLTAWYAGAFLVTLLAIGVAAYLVVRQELDSEIDDSLENAARDLNAGLLGRLPAEGGNGDNHDDEDEHHDDDDDEERVPPSLGSDVFVVTTDAGGTVLSNPRRVNLEGLDLLALSANGDEGPRDAAGEHDRFRILTREMGDGTLLHVGRSLETRDHQLTTLAVTLAVGGVVGLAFSTAAGWGLAGRTLAPIRRSLEVQRRFVSDASHELRTPIATVKANNELLLRHPEQTVEANYDQVEAIAAESDHMARLVGDLLTLARADEGRLELGKERFDLAELAQEVARDIEPLAEAQGLTLTAELERALVEADRQRTRQLLVILLDNAMKYTPPGGRVTLRTGKDGKRAVMSVADTGPGIAPEHHARIFDRFYRVDTSRARSEGGTGLGLAIARWIAEAHGGRITLDSAPGKGSTFTVRLPGAG